MIKYPITYKYDGGFRTLEPGLPVRVVDLNPGISNALNLSIENRDKREYLKNRRTGLIGSLGPIWDNNIEAGLWVLYPEGCPNSPSIYHYSELIVTVSDKIKTVFVSMVEGNLITRVRLRTFVGLRTDLTSLLKRAVYDWSKTLVGTTTIAALQKQGERFTWKKAFECIPADWWLQHGIVEVEFQDRDCESITLLQAVDSSPQ